MKTWEETYRSLQRQAESKEFRVINLGIELRAAKMELQTTRRALKLAARELPRRRETWLTRLLDKVTP